jgi:lysyl-tRNA synthetase class 2
VDGWQPSASLAVLRQRAAMLARARQFFAAARVLEVDTSVMVGAAVTDVHIESARVLLEAGAADAPRAPRFLHTSPEYAMKRLLAGGSGDIYQICHVMRGFERSALHNPEFTLIEWYRIGVTLEALMQEVESLVRALLDAAAAGYRSEHLTYREAFLRELRLDPFEASLATLDAAAHAVGYRAAPAPGASGERRDELLELLMGTTVGPRLGRGALTFVSGYPASQAALARLDAHDARAARRFELYCEGMELANGFHELASAPEQRARFERDQAERAQLGRPAHALDERLLAALESGLPDCCGVALGFDRVVMLATHARHIDEVLAFPDERA